MRKNLTTIAGYAIGAFILLKKEGSLLFYINKRYFIPTVESLLYYSLDTSLTDIQFITNLFKMVPSQTYLLLLLSSLAPFSLAFKTKIDICPSFNLPPAQAGGQVHAEPDCVGEKPFISVAFQDALNLANDARGVLLKTERAAYFTRFYDMLFQDKGGKKFRPSTSEIAGE